MVRGKFDSKVEAFAQLTSDNRLKIWDVATGSASADYTPEGKLASELTALAWGLGAPSSSSSKKKKAKRVAEVVAVGTVRGDVLLWDCARNEVQATLGGEGTEQTSRVHDLAFSSSGSQLFVATDDGSVVCWHVATGAMAWKVSTGKQPVRRLAVHADGDQMATGATTLKLWDLATRTCARKLTGHASAITSLAYSQDCSLLFSSSGDRFINVWDTAPEAASTAALRVLTLDATPVHLHASARGEDAATVMVLAVSEAGAVGVWEFETPGPKQRRKSAGGGGTPEAPQCWIGKGGQGAVWGAAWRGEEVQVSRGSAVLPTFESVEVVGADGALVEGVGLSRVDESGLLLAKGKEEGKKSKRERREAETMHRAEVPMAGMGGEGEGEGEGATQKSKRRGWEGMEVEGEEEEDAGSLDGDDTLEAKVRALGLEVADDQAMIERGRGGGAGALRADSMHTALVQAVESDDKVLLAQCLGVTNPRVISATVARLPPRTVGALLKTVVGKFQLKPARSVALVTWIRAILTQHTSLLMAQPDVVRSLTPLYQLVEARVSTYHKLLKLGGRLELALNQVSHREGGKKEMGSKVPELVVDETGGEADDVVGGIEDSDEEEEEGDEEMEEDEDEEERDEDEEDEDEDEDEDEENDDEDEEDEEDD